jgi:predicted TIM-barrel fold metal-dependent hydrolase
MKIEETVEEYEPFIDAHHHFWDLGRNNHPWLQQAPLADFRYGDYSALRRNYLPADLLGDMAGVVPCASVHVEAEWARPECVEETRWLHKLAEQHALPTVIVAYAPLDAENVGEVLGAQAAQPRVRGIRHKPAVTSSAQDMRRGAVGSMDDTSWRDGYALLGRHGLSFDLQAPWWHLEQAADLAQDFPMTPLILNHAGLPADRSAAGLAAWRKALAQLADLPNTAIKLSGMGQRGQPWPQQENIVLIREAIAIFGYSRCMFASNFPVDSLVTTYPVLFATFQQAIASYSAKERRALLQDNARRFYRIP